MGDIITAKGIKYTFIAEYSDLKRGIQDMLGELTKLKREVSAVGTEFKQSMGQVKRETDQAAQSVRTMARSTRESFGQIKDGMQSIVTVAAGVTATLTTMVAAPAKFFGDFEAALNDFRAKSDASLADTEKFKKVALETGQASKYTATQAALAGVELVKLGKNSQEAAALLPSIVKGADATGESLNTVSKTLLSVMNAYKMGTAESIKVLDQLVTVANTSATDVGEMAISFQYASGVAANSNQSFTDLAAALGLVAQQGIPASMAGNHLENMFVRLSTKPKEAADTIEQFGLKLETAEGKLKPWPAMMEDMRAKFAGLSDTQIIANFKRLFGEVATPSALALFKSTNEEVANYIKVVENAAGATDKAAKIMRQGLNYEFEQLVGSVQTLAIEIGEQLAPTLIELLKIGRGITEWFSNLSPGVKSFMGHVLLATTAIVGMTAALGSFGFVSATIVKGVMDLASGFKYMVGVDVVSWITRIGLAARGLLATFAPWIAALTALYFAYQTNFAGIKDIVDGFLEFISPALKDLGKWFGDAGREITFAFKGAFDNLKIIFSGIEDVIRHSMGMIGSSMAVFGFLIRGQFAEAKEAALKFAEDFKGAMSGVGKVILPGLQADPNTYGSKSLDELKANAKAQRDQAWNRIGMGSQEPSGFVPRVVKSIDEIKKAEKNAQDQALEAAKKLVEIEETRHNNRITNLEKEHEKVKAHVHDEMVDFSRPLTKGVQTSGYGMRWGKLHAGLDIAAPVGTPIKAQAAGIVAQVGFDPAGYGKYVVIDHGNGKYSLYGHASEVYAKLNQKVKAGENIAAIGSTGHSTGPHLHQEERMGPAGLRGGAVFQARPIQPGQVTVSGEAKAAVEHEKALNSEMNVHVVMLEKIRQQIIKNGNSTDALKFVEEKLRDAREKAGTQSIDILKAERKVQEEMIKAAQDAYTEYLGEIIDKYKELDSKVADTAKNVKEANDQFKEQQRTAGMSQAELTAYNVSKEILATRKMINQAKRDEAFLTQQITNIKDANKGTIVNKEVQQELNKLTEQQNKLAKDRVELEKEFKTQIKLAAVEMAQADFEQYWKEYTAGLDKAKEKLDNLIKDPKMLQNFSLDLQAGKTSLEQFFGGVELTQNQIDELAQAMAQMDFDAWESGIDSAAKATEKAAKEQQDAMLSVVGYVNEAIAAFGNLPGAIGEIAQESGRILSGMSSVVEKAIRGDWIAALVSLASTVVTQLGEGIANAFGANQEKLKQQVTDYKNAIRDAENEILNMRKNRLAQQGQLTEAQLRQQAADEKEAILNAAYAQQDAARAKLKENVELARKAGYSSNLALETYNSTIKEIQATFDQGMEDANNRLANNLANLNNELYIKQSEQYMQQLEKSRDEYFNNRDKELQEQAKQDEEQAKRRTSYLDKQSMANAAKAQAVAFMDGFKSSLSDVEAQELLGPMMEQAAGQWQTIVKEIQDAFAPGDEYDQELTRRSVEFYKDLSMKANEAIAKHKAKLVKEEQERTEKNQQTLDKMLKDRLDTIKRLRQQELDDALKIQQIKLDTIDKEIAAKEKMKQQEIKDFNANDLTKLEQAMSKIDTTAFMRKALAEVHNPEGVKTETYSAETRRDAIKERLDSMDLENRLALAKKEKSAEQFKQTEIEIAATRAKITQDELGREGLDIKDRKELQEEWLSALKDFQTKSTEIITEKYDEQIKKEDERKASIEETMNSLKESAKTDLDFVTKQIDSLTTSNLMAAGSFDAMLRSAQTSFKSMASIVADPNLTLVPWKQSGPQSASSKGGMFQMQASDGRYYMDTAAMEQANRLYYAGNTPQTTAGDSYNVTVTGNYFKSDVDVKKAFSELLADIKGSRANSSYVATLGG